MNENNEEGQKQNEPEPSADQPQTKPSKPEKKDFTVTIITP